MASPLLWSLVAGKLLWELNDDYYTVGYVDDTAFLNKGIFPQTVMSGLTNSSMHGPAGHSRYLYTLLQQ
jgi:hypothetical protein